MRSTLEVRAEMTVKENRKGRRALARTRIMMGYRRQRIIIIGSAHMARLTRRKREREREREEGVQHRRRNFLRREEEEEAWHASNEREDVTKKNERK